MSESTETRGELQTGSVTKQRHWLWTRFLDPGVGPELPDGDVKHVRATNVAALIGIVTMSPWIPVSILAGQWLNAIINAAFVVGCFVVRRLNAGHHWAFASVLLMSIGHASLVYACAWHGAESGSPLYYAQFIVVPYLVFPRRRRRTAHLFALCAVVGMVVFHGFGEHFPQQIPMIDVAQQAFANVVVSAVMLFVLAAVFLRTVDAAEDDLVDKQAELSRSNAQLEEQHQELQRSQEALVRAEKLAALGQLSAGVAHELNTPLGAIRACAGNLERSVDDTITKLPDALAAAAADERATLFRLVGDSGAVSLSSREHRQARRRLSKELEESSVPEAAEAASQLVDIGVSELDPATLELLQSPRRAALLAAAFNLAALRRNASTIQLSVERASKIVFAFKSYAQPGAQDDRTEGAIADGIETALTLYEAQTSHGVEIERAYDGRGVVEASHHELNQVWTNLVHNAIQAMKLQGNLRIGIEENEDSVIVSVRDDGPGVADDVLERIFEPFFTTKPEGEGTGLGLAICKEIVERHRGTLTVATGPSGTTFTTTLPRHSRR